MALSPIKEGQLKLSHSWKKVRISVSFKTQLLCHVLHYAFDSLVPFVGLIGDQKVKLAVLLYFNTNVIESLDWSITSKEILRARSECDYLQLLQSDYGPGHRNKVHYHPCHSLTVSHRILRDVGRNIPQVQVIGAV